MEPDEANKVLKQIDKEEIAKLTLDLANCYSPPGLERESADYVFNYLTEAGLIVKKIGLFPDRFNVLGSYPGNSDGYSLLFNGHLDVWLSRKDKWILRDPDKPIYHQAWRVGDRIVGNGVVNDKGPLVAALVAAKAIRKSGIELKGDLLVSASPGEVSTEPVDEFEAPTHSGKDVGARFLVTHGGVADYVLIAEATNFCLGWVEAGKAWFKVTMYGEPPVYTPFLQRPANFQNSPNAIVRVSKFIEIFERWAYQYEKTNTRDFKGGTVIPKASVNAIRGGDPTKALQTPEVCSVYVDVRLLPGADPLDIKRQLERLVMEASGDKGVVELYHFRPGYEAKAPSRIVESVSRVHSRIFSEKPRMVNPPTSSMWRDMNVFNEVGVPAITYGPGTATGAGKYTDLTTGNSMELEDLVTCSKAYALIAMDLCNSKKS